MEEVCSLQHHTATPCSDLAADGSFSICSTTAYKQLMIKHAETVSCLLSLPWDSETSSAESREKPFFSCLHNTRSWLRLLGAAFSDGDSSSSSGVKPPRNSDANVFAYIRIDTGAGQAGQNE